MGSMGAAPTMRATYQRTPAHSRYSRREASAAGRVHARSEGGPPLRARSRTTSSTIVMRCPAAVNSDLVGWGGVHRRFPALVFRTVSQFVIHVVHTPLLASTGSRASRLAAQGAPLAVHASTHLVHRTVSGLCTHR